MSTSGNNNNSGSINSPLRNIEYAVLRADPGDTIIIRGGTYLEMVKAYGVNGTPSAPIIVTAYPGELVVVISNDWAGFDIASSSWLIVDNLTIRNAPSDGIYITNAHHITVRNCKVYNNGGVGIHILSSRGPASDNTVQNNEVHDNNQEGIYADVKRSNPAAVDNNLIENNIITGNGYDGVQNTNENGVAPYPAGTTIRGNYVENNGGWATMDLAGNNLTIKDNTVINRYSNAGAVYYAHGNGSVISGNTIYNYYRDWSGGDAIVIRDVYESMIEDNTIISTISGSVGIRVYQPAEVILRNNDITIGGN